MRSTKPTLILTLLSLSLTIPAAPVAAGILYINGAFQWEEELQLSPTVILKLQYDSRATNTGLFGFGWCSDLDQKIVVSDNTDAGDIRYEHCGRSITFIKKAEDTSIYMNKSTPENVLLRQASTWIYMQSGRRKFSFDIKGNLRWIHPEHAESIALQSNTLGHTIDLLSINKKFQLVLNKETQKIEQIHADGNNLLRLVYNNQNWIRYLKVNKSPVEFSYDEYHNLIQRREGAITTFQNIYDISRDLITQHTNIHDCGEKIDYTVQLKTLRVKSDLQCRTAILKSTLMIFVFGETVDSKAVLQRSVIQNHNETVTMTWHADLGLPTSILRNGNKTEFSYNSLGLIEQIKNQGSLVHMQYDKTHRLSNYSSNGYKLNLTYDSNGRLRRISTSSNNRVIYEEPLQGQARLPASPAERLLVQNVLSQTR